MDWQQRWIDGVLSEIPAGGYRRRLEAELRDHLDSQCRALMESGRSPDKAQAEALRLMGEPERLQKEYETAWRRSLPGRLGRLGQVGRLLGTWAKGSAVMGGSYLAVNSVMARMLSSAIALPRDSTDPKIQAVRLFS